ncbi:MAG: hypothetical protein J6A25_01090 [Lachnospiraceae bacterium]|nr:hypothetical protein [Lachnospiraceae bacterium]
MVNYSTHISARGEYRLDFKTTDPKAFEAVEALVKQLYEAQEASMEADEKLSRTIRMDEGPDQFKNIYYKPTCKYGCIDCIYDPAYIKETYPRWYKSLFGEMTPLDAACWDGTCADCRDCDKYDDEDK